MSKLWPRFPPIQGQAVIFPTLDPRNPVAPINLNEVARAWLARNGIGPNDPNPLIEPGPCAEMLREEHERLGVECSYGGWMEDRSTVWRGSYLDEKGTYLHLGVDFNVAAGTQVAVDRPSIVMRVDNDHPEKHGWGTRVVVLIPQQPRIVLIYAHLAADVAVRADDELHPGDVIGRVGSPDVNGGWYSHLHVQAMCVGKYAFLGMPGRKSWRDIDGYGAVADRTELVHEYPDPSPWLCLRP